VHEIPVKGWDNLESIAWTANGAGLFASTRKQRTFMLLSIDSGGNVRVLWTERGATGLDAVPSPDGRHVAMFRRVLNENMWTMENF
jgi:hypothetical protein